MNAKNVLSSPLRYLDKALNGLRDLGLMPQKPDEMPVIALINQISDLDEEKTVAIARTLSNTTVFNEVVREQIASMNVGERYETITKAFDSIRDDAKNMVEQLDDGKIDTMERLSNFWMKVTRGDIPSRFDKIKKTYLEVSADTKDQMDAGPKEVHCCLRHSWWFTWFISSPLSRRKTEAGRKPPMPSTFGSTGSTTKSVWPKSAWHT